MKTKAQKTAKAKKNAELEKAKKKAVRDAKSSTVPTGKAGAKSKSIVPQSKSVRKK